MSAPPLVTVAIPTIDRPDMLRRAIASVLCQSHRNLQVLVSDNASATEMRAVATAFGDSRVEFQRHACRLPMGASWNSCLAAARGEFFLLLSDDDALHREGIERLVAAFCQGDGVDSIGLSYGRTQVEDPLGRQLWLTHAAPPRERAMQFAKALFSHRRAVYPCATMFRTEDLRALGGYDSDRFGAAADLAAALASAFRRGSVAFSPAVVCCYTEHAGNLTGNLRLEQWQKWLDEIERLVTSQDGLGSRERRALRRSVRAYSAYFLMDVAGKGALLAGGSVAHALRKALAATTLAGGHGLPGARLRIAAKLTYLGLARLLQSWKHKISG